MSGLRKDLQAMSGDQAASSLMVGIGESYFAAFVLALSSSQLACGLVSSVPLLAGALVQVAAPFALRRLGSYRLWVCSCAVLQGLAFVPLAVAALWGSLPLTAVFGVVALYWAAGLGAGPAWTSWVETLLPVRIRARYLARRTRIGQSATLLGFVAGGALLQWGTSCQRPLVFFAVLFAVAAAGRLTAASFLARQSEPERPSEPAPRAGEMLTCLVRDGNGPLFAYLLVVQLATQISGPYFTPYMLKQLSLSYWEYVLLVATAFLAKIFCLPAVGGLADRVGSRRLLWIGGAAVVPISALWALSDRFVYLLGVQILSGAAWAVYELATLLLAFESVPAARRVKLLSVYNVASAAAVLVGSLVGGALLAALGQTREAYLALFVISSLVRALPIPLLARLPRAAWPIPAPGASPRLRVAVAPQPTAELFPQGPHWERRSQPAPPRAAEPTSAAS